jgi:hypothetical protein
VPRHVAADGRVLDLDDLGAEIGEQLGAEGAGAELRDGQDAKPRQRCRCSDGWFCSDD